jgi:phosphotriesterase-related protein
MDVTMSSASIQTVKGPVAVENFGLILPHEHLFTDLRGPATPDYAQADPEDVVRIIMPDLEAANAAGATALVECSTVGVGRNVRILKRLADATPVHIIAPTGVYRDAFVPAALRDLSAAAVADLWIRDLTQGIDGIQVRAGFIKIAMSDDGPTPIEVRNLKAAARASRETGAVIASHTIGGSIARREMDILESEGLDLRRFIWVHTQAEPDVAFHLEAARRGAYVEYDAIGAAPNSDAAMRDFVLEVIKAGLVQHGLLSHDAGWYQPGEPGGNPTNGKVRGYTALMTEFIPALRAAGVSTETIQQMTVTNPAQAFAIKN